MSTANKLTYLNGTKQAIKQAINEDFEVIDNNTTFREYADEISSNNAKYKDLIPKETKNATNTLDISNSSGLDKALVTQYGNTYQEGEPTPDSPQEIQVVTGDNEVKVEGKNLFNNNVEVKNAYVSSNIGSVINYVNSTATVSYVNCCYLESGTTYTISYEKNTPASTSQRGSAIVDTNNTVLEMIPLWDNNNTSITFTPTYSGYLVCVVDKNSTNIQIEKCSTATTVEGKNLFNNNVEVKNAYVSSNIGSVINYVNSTATVSYVNCCYLESGTTYTISYEKNTPASTSQRGSAIVDTNNTVLEMIPLWDNNNTSITFTPTYSGYLVCVVDKNSTNIQIEKGSTATTYEPYQSQSYPINLGNIELCKIYTYKDRIYPLNGKWYLNKQIGKVVLDGSESWTSRAFPNNSYLSVKMTMQIGANGGFSDKFISNNRYDIVEEHLTLSSQWNEICFAILKSRLSTPDVTGFKSWLSTNQPIVYYVLATPTTEEITESNYPTLYNQLNNIKLFEGVNHITMTNERGLDVEFDITYYKDWKLD